VWLPKSHGSAEAPQGVPKAHSRNCRKNGVSENGRQTSIYGHVNGKNDDITNGWNGIASFPFFSGKSCFSDK